MLVPSRQSARRRQSPAGRTFSTTLLVISLLATYSFLRSLSQDRARTEERLQSRSLQIQDRDCRLVHDAHDKCAFIKANCPDEEAGLISYLSIYYCSLPHVKAVGFILLVLWSGLLFSTIGIAASDFLCVNLSTIATLLGMSESLTGVTFLAFGNGSPDVFSTFAAMSSHSGSLAVGELLGAASFITAVVAGSMALVKPFQVARRSFVRDVAFFAVAASFSLVFLADGKLRLWECVVMISFYIFYVVFVVIWHWWMTRSRRAKLAETAARLEHHIPDSQELEVPEIEDDDEVRPASERNPLLRSISGGSIPTLITPGTPAWKLQEDEDDETRDRYLAELQSNMRVNRRPGNRRNTITPIRPSLIGALEFRSVLSALEKKSTSQSFNLRRYSDDASNFLNSATDGQQSASQPDLLITGDDEDDTPPRLSNSGRTRAVSANDASRLHINTDLLAPSQEESVLSASPSSLGKSAERPSASILRTLDDPAQSSSPKLVLSPAEDRNQGRSPRLLAPPGSGFHQPDYQEHHRDANQSPILSPGHQSPVSPARDSSLQVPTLRSPRSEHRKHPVSNEFPAYVDSPQTRSPSSASSRPPSIRLPSASLSPDSTHTILVEHDDEEGEMRKFAWWPYQYLPAPQIIASTLFPTLYGWRNKSIPDKLISLVTAPTVLLLTVTLPVVETSDENDIQDQDPTPRAPAARSRANTLDQLSSVAPEMAGKRSGPDAPAHPHRQSSRPLSDVPAKTPLPNVDEIAEPQEWNRWLVFLQVFTAPLFVVTIVWANMDEEHHAMLFIKLVLGSLVFSLICLFALLATTSHDKIPTYRPLFCFLGFSVAIAWISTIANEVVGVLKAFGVILDMSDAILGLTIFAVGNSCGDLVADITVAKLGYPVMALSACFGGPMLNILLGIGISGMYMTIRHGLHKHEKHPDRPIKYKPYQVEISTTLMISGVTLLVTLLGLLLVVPLNGWRMDRRIGLGLIALWTCSTVANVVVEVLGYSDTWSQ